MAGLAAQLDTLVATLPAISNKLAEVDQKQQELASMVTSGAAAPFPRPGSRFESCRPASFDDRALSGLSPPAAGPSWKGRRGDSRPGGGDRGGRPRRSFGPCYACPVSSPDFFGAAAGGSGRGWFTRVRRCWSLGVRGSAQRARLQEDLAQGRGLFYQQVCANMARRMMPSQQPGASQTELVNQGISLTRYWERFGGWSGSRDLGLLAFQVGLIFDALLNDRVQLAKDHLALLAVCLEQAAMDGGRMEVAYQMTFLEDPPSSMFMARAGPSARSRAFAPLASQRWVSQARRGEQTRPKGQAAQDTASKTADSPPRRRPPKKKPPGAQ